MTTLTHYHTSGVLCDATGCDAVFRWPMTSAWSHAQKAMQVAHECGWRTFVSRSKRHYCPDHGPRPGHKMREVTR